MFYDFLSFTFPITDQLNVVNGSMKLLSESTPSWLVLRVELTRMKLLRASLSNYKTQLISTLVSKIKREKFSNENPANLLVAQVLSNVENFYRSCHR